MSSIRRSLLALSVAAALVGAAPPGAHAAVSVPEVDLRVDRDRQRGGLFSEAWTDGDRSGCAGISAYGPGKYPHALPVAADQARARFVFHTPLKPKRVSIWSYARKPRDGDAGERLEALLRERRSDEGAIVAWRAVFPIAPQPHTYLDLSAKWRPGRCGPPRELFYGFHLGAASR